MPPTHDPDMNSPAARATLPPAPAPRSLEKGESTKHAADLAYLQAMSDGYLPVEGLRPDAKVGVAPADLPEGLHPAEAVMETYLSYLGAPADEPKDFMGRVIARAIQREEQGRGAEAAKDYDQLRQDFVHLEAGLERTARLSHLPSAQLKEIGDRVIARAFVRDPGRAAQSLMPQFETALHESPVSAAQLEAIMGRVTGRAAQREALGHADPAEHAADMRIHAHNASRPSYDDVIRSEKSKTASVVGEPGRAASQLEAQLEVAVRQSFVGSRTVEYVGRQLVARAARQEADRHDDDIADGIANDPAPPYESTDSDRRADADIGPPPYPHRGLVRRLGGIGAAHASLNNIAGSIVNAVTASGLIVSRLVERDTGVENRMSREAMSQSVAMGSGALRAPPGPIYDGMNPSDGRSPIVAREMNDSRTTSRNEMASEPADAAGRIGLEDRSRVGERARSMAR
jgi:hypothetical protein